MKVATVLVQANVPFALSDQLSPLLKEIFPDSQIAAGYAAKKEPKQTVLLMGH